MSDDQDNQGDSGPIHSDTVLARQRERRAKRQLARRLAAKRAVSAAGALQVRKFPNEISTNKPAATSLATDDERSSAPAIRAQAWPTMVLPVEILIESRRARRRTLFTRLGLFCGLPTLLTLLYMLFIASPRYITEFEITYMGYQPQTNLASGLVQQLSGAGQGNAVDMSAILFEYIRSGSLLKKIDEQLNLRDYYSSHKADYLSRMNAKANMTTFLSYYHWYVSVSEGQGGYLTVDVEAFDPQYSLAVSKAIVTAVDEMFDDLTTRARQDAVRFAETQVTQTETRVRASQMALTEFQNAHTDLNPTGTAGQLGGIVGQLESDLSGQRTLLATTQSLGPNSPQIAAINSKIKAIEAQLTVEKARLTATSGGKSYADLLNKYAALQLEQEFAKNAYLQAQQGLATARADAARKENYLIDFAPPHEPDKAGAELVIKYTSAVFVLTLMLFGIGSMIAGAMRDQSGE